MPHKESESQVEADLTYGIDLYELNHRVNAQENIVGWWATGNEVNYIKNCIYTLIEMNMFYCNNFNRLQLIHLSFMNIMFVNAIILFI